MNKKTLSTKVACFSAALASLLATGCSGAGDSGFDTEVVGSQGEALTQSSYAFVWSSQLTGTFTAPDAYSSASNNVVTWLSTGLYRVDFPNKGTQIGGDVQVTAYGGTSERCKVDSWGSSGSTLQVYVRCFTPSGTATNSLFTASYVGRAGVVGAEGGYVWADQPSLTDYTPNTTYQWSSTGGFNTIHRNSAGSYTVHLPGQTFTGGTVEVTAYGSGSEYCKVQGWGPGVSDQQVNVGCFTTTGAPVDARFTLVFSKGSPNYTPSYSYAWASSPSSSWYTPSSTYQRGFIAGDGPVNGGFVTSPLATISRTGVGSYTVHLPQMSASGGTWGKSNAKVTGYGYDTSTCKIIGWYNSGDGVDANVACRNAAGTLADAYYTITFSTTQFIIG